MPSHLERALPIRRSSKLVCTASGLCASIKNTAAVHVADHVAFMLPAMSHYMHVSREKKNRPHLPCMLPTMLHSCCRPCRITCMFLAKKRTAHICRACCRPCYIHVAGHVALHACFSRKKEPPTSAVHVADHVTFMLPAMSHYMHVSREKKNRPHLPCMLPTMLHSC